MNESIDELNKQLIESRNAYEQLTRVNDQLSVESEKICQENNDLRLKYAQTHDCLVETKNSFNTFKGKRFYSNFLAPPVLHTKNSCSKINEGEILQVICFI